MKSNDLLNCAIRVKQEASHMSLVETDSEMIDVKPDLKSFQFLPFPRENSPQTIEKCEENPKSELYNEVEIIVECEDVKLNFDLLSLKKIDGYSPNQVKQEYFGDDAEHLNLTFDCKLVEQNKTKRITKKSDRQRRLESRINTVPSGGIHLCKACGKTFKRKINLNLLNL
ncbi:hypothetical protein TKK_0000916 [Trichogramma kaykai]